MTTKEKIEVMQAFEDGKTIQIISENKKNWNNAMEFNRDNQKEPDWNWANFQYRVKPEWKPKVIPASLTELDVMANYSWFRFNSTPLAEEILHAPRSIITKKEGIQILNSVTKCWEDWSK